MSFLQLLVAVIVIGLTLYGITLLPIKPPFQRILAILVILFSCVWLLDMAGIIHVRGL